ncbi:N-6 DNA methylase [Actinomadura sp. K4S16]|uniref:N-6 DNA methylase n=1 Tax=Actinomadura sp. K4S16 TaxID=1316147 RepID=UPI00190F53AE|nr:N-6 DNA methylase [Actinomadura sp. K4S16]
MRKDATVTASDIARLARVSRGAVSNWRRRHPDFPQPIGGTPTSPVFSLAEVETWLRRQGKLAEVPSEERAWQLLCTVGDEREIGAVLRQVGDWQRAGTPITGLSDRAAAKRLGVDQRSVPLLRAVDELSGEWDTAPAFEFLVERYLEVRLPRLTLTSPELAALIAGLVDQDARSVLDPACGTGELLSALSAAREGEPRRLYGQERDEVLAPLAENRLALRGIPAEIRGGDSLRHDAFVGLTVDAVVCDPPFNERYWGYEDLAADPRWEYGLPPRMEPEMAWIQHALAHLVPGGLAVLLVPPAVAGRRSGRRMRTQLLRRGALQAVVALPAGPHLWLLRKPAGDRPTGLLVMDGADDAEIFRTWRDFQAGRDVDRPGTSRVVPIIDLLDEEADLTPARHLAAFEGDRTAERFVQTLDRLRALLDRMSGLVPELEPVRPDRETAVTSVAELARIGALTVHRAPARGDAGKAGTERPLLTAEDVLQYREPSGRALIGAEDDWIVTRTGDIAVAVASRRFAARVVQRDGLVLGPHLSLVRVDPQALDPYFLAGVLRSTANVRSSSLSSTGTRVDVHRARVPRLPMDEQRRFGEAFRRMEQFASAARESLALSELMDRLLADGVAEGDLGAVGG